MCYMAHPLKQALEGIAKADFKYVELISIPNWVAEEHVNPEMGEEHLRKVESLLNEYNLSTISLSGHIDFLVMGPQSTKVAMKALEKRIELAARLGCKYVNTGAWTFETQVFYDTVYEILDLCKSHNIILGLEVGEPGLTSTGKELMKLLNPIRSENIGINYDTGNIRWLTGIEPETDLPSTLGRLVHMHVKDQAGGRGKEEFPALGDGEVDFTKVFDVVKKMKFEGPFIIEIEMPAENAAQRDDDVKRCKDYLEKHLQYA